MKPNDKIEAGDKDLSFFLGIFSTHASKLGEPRPRKKPSYTGNFPPYIYVYIGPLWSFTSRLSSPIGYYPFASYFRGSGRARAVAKID